MTQFNHPITKSLIHSIVMACGVMTAATHAQEWSQWRGPSRDGSVVAANLPAAWPTTAQRMWRVEVGEGYSSPVVVGGRVFVHSRRDPEEIVTAVDFASGKVLWQQKYAAPFAKNQYAVRMAKGPNSTPIVIGQHLYTLGVTGVLTAWRVADGTVAWRQDYSGSVDTSKLFCGTAMSPMLEGGALIVQVGSDIHGGQVLALDPATGTPRWTWKGPGPGYASPIVLTAAGVRQIVTLTNQSIVGIDAKTGASLWSIPFPDEWHENIVSPLWTGSQLIVSGVRQGTQAFTLANTGGTWQATQAWKNADITMYMSAPVAADGVIYGISNKRKGQFVALNAATGAVRWSTDGREGEHASILLGPAHVMFLTNVGDLIVAKRDGAKFNEERRIEVADGETWAVPAFVPGGIVIRDGQGLARLGWHTP
ncbi:MAG TPA: PQQ-binding-like beta-propeller repeat protein [Vicinamibacterales bacterium]|nr:PQQ-binding-like beta-propeller repeat protein [Vicinamibacterales bacterium]